MRGVVLALVTCVCLAAGSALGGTVTDLGEVVVDGDGNLAIGVDSLGSRTVDAADDGPSVCSIFRGAAPRCVWPMVACSPRAGSLRPASMPTSCTRSCSRGRALFSRTRASSSCESNANLAGELIITVSEDFATELGDTFFILDYTSRVGEFDQISGLQLTDGLALRPVYASQGLYLTTVPEPSTASLLGGGLLALATMRCVRRARV